MSRALSIAAVVATALSVALVSLPAQAELYEPSKFPSFAKPVAQVYLRNGPGSNYAVDALMPRGELLFVDTCQGEWCHVKRDNGSVGWTTIHYLVTVPTPADRNADGSKKLGGRVLDHIGGPVISAPVLRPLPR
ncbi:SH3 domain-containing protein [Devosia sp. 2618]|uniref:SH3 domain-containing protein n=1 Tax=Devosia sp. 2618 TaxID=3156454 RepID=UPI003397F2E5